MGLWCLETLGHQVHWNINGPETSRGLGCCHQGRLDFFKVPVETERWLGLMLSRPQKHQVYLKPLRIGSFRVRWCFNSSPNALKFQESGWKTMGPDTTWIPSLIFIQIGSSSPKGVDPFQTSILRQRRAWTPKTVILQVGGISDFGGIKPTSLFFGHTPNGLTSSLSLATTWTWQLEAHIRMIGSLLQSAESLETSGPEKNDRRFEEWQ